MSETLDRASDLRLTTETTWRQGPWKFVSQGTIGAYPRWVHAESGLTVFHHAVAEVKP